MSDWHELRDCVIVLERLVTDHHSGEDVRWRVARLREWIAAIVTRDQERIVERFESRKKVREFA